MRSFLLLVTAVSLVACGNDDSSADAGTPADGGGDVESPDVDARECGADRDCDDGLHCNGIERCIDDYCQPGIAPNCTPEHRCTEVTKGCDCAKPDHDEDGADGESCGGRDCRDDDVRISPLLEEVCAYDGDAVDEDCDPNTFYNKDTNDGDADGDGHFNKHCYNLRPDGSRSSGDDCDDSDELTRPDAGEQCDYVDNDCDDMVDEGEVGDASVEGALQVPFYPDVDRDGYPDHDAGARYQCETRPLLGWLTEDHPDDCNDSNRDVNIAEQEVCDGQDNDCDSFIDADDDNEQPMLLPYDFEDTVVLCDADLHDVDGDGFKQEWQLQCPDGRAWCSGRPETGCETIATTITHCGDCVTACTFSCEAGTCDEVESVALGAHHSCARTTSNAVACWGRAHDGQLGNDSQKATATASAVLGISDAERLVAGGNSTCVIRAGTGELNCWGSNAYGQLGNIDAGLFSARAVAVRAPYEPVLRGVADVAVSYEFACAVLASHELLCWGSELYGRLANAGSSEFNWYIPELAIGDDNFDVTDAVAVTLGERHGCIVRDGGTVSCWGDNAFGQLGDPSFQEDHASRVRAVPGLLGVSAIAAGGFHTCAIRNGDVLCWGSNESLQLGHEGATLSAMPTVVEGLNDITAIAAGSDLTCAIDAEAGLWCWGANSSGKRGDPNPDPAAVPFEVPIPDVSVVAIGASHACASTLNDATYCWGEAFFGQLGDGAYSADSSFMVREIKPLERE